MKTVDGRKLKIKGKITVNMMIGDDRFTDVTLFVVNSCLCDIILGEH